MALNNRMRFWAQLYNNIGTIRGGTAMTYFDLYSRLRFRRMVRAQHLGDWAEGRVEDFGI